MAKILGVKIDRIDFKETMAKVAAFLMVDEVHQIATVNPEFLVAAARDDYFKEILNRTDLNVADGVGLKIAAFLTGQKIGERITGVDLTWSICKFASENNYSIYFLGAGEGVAENAANRIKLLHRDLKISGTYAGTPQEEGIVDRINNASPDILFVSFGSPAQEKFIDENKARLKAKLAMGVGGTFDYIAGIHPYAPAYLRKAGLEWLYRLFTQPKRWRRIFNATFVFLGLVVKSRFEK